MVKVNSQWLKGLTDREKEDFINLLTNNRKILDKLQEIVYNIVNELETSHKTDYDCPSWSHKQAHKNGEVEMAKRIIQLTEIKGA